MGNVLNVYMGFDVMSVVHLTQLTVKPQRTDPAVTIADIPSRDARLSAAAAAETPDQ